MFFEWDFVPLISRFVKTDESEKIMPLDEEMITDLLRWRSETPYAGRPGLDLRQRTHEESSATLAGSYRAELHPTGGGTGKDHQARQLARIPPHIFYPSCGK